MRTLTEYLWFNTKKRQEFIRITDEVAAAVKKSDVKEGMVLVSAMHITAAVYVNDWESGLIHDFQEWLEKLAPAGLNYQHHQTGEDNADAHLKRTLMGHQVILPITDGKLDLGPWEQVFYAEFDGQRKKRVIVKVMGNEPRVTDRRKYPDRPYVGVGAVIVQDGQVLIVKRKYDPLAGQWSLPGGGVELGETLEDSIVREMLEETGLRIEVGPVIEVFDRITRDEKGDVRYHFVLVDYLCWPVGGELQAGSDVADALFIDPEQLPGYNLTVKANEVIARALELDRQAPRPVR